jgi:hypothetical protein
MVFVKRSVEFGTEMLRRRRWWAGQAAFYRQIDNGSGISCDEGLKALAVAAL